MLGSQRIRKVGTCGMSGMRCAVTEAMARTRPTSAISFQVDRCEIHLPIAANHGGHGVGRALERHMHDVDCGRLAEQRADEERRAGEAGRGEIQRSRLRLRQCDDLAEILGRNSRIDDEIGAAPS